MFIASSRGRRIPAALHVLVIAMLAMTLIGPLVTPLIAEAAQTPTLADEPLAATEGEPSTAGQPPPPATDPVETIDEPTTAPVVQQEDEAIDEPATDPTGEPTSEAPATDPVVEPDDGASLDEPGTEPAVAPDIGDNADSPGELITEPADEPLVGPGTPTSDDIDPETNLLESAAADEPAAAATMRFTQVRIIGPSDCTPESVAFVEMKVEDADPTFRGVEIFLLATNVQTGEVAVLGSTIVEASRGSGIFFQPVTGDFGPGFTDFRVELYLVDGEGNDQQSQIVPVVPDCDGNQPVPPPMRFTQVGVFGPDDCTATSEVEVILTVNDADPTFQGVVIRLLATRTADNRPLILSDAAIDPSRGNGRFGSLLRGNFTAEFSDWRVQVILFDDEGGIHQQQTFPTGLNCVPPPEPPAPPAPPMQFSQVQTFGPDACDSEGTLFVGLTIQNADPAFKGVELFLFAFNASSGQAELLNTSLVEASRGSGKFLQPITGDFSASFRDFRVELRLVDGLGNGRQSLIVPVVPDCDGDQPVPMRFTQVAVFGPENCIADTLMQVDLTVNDADPTFQGIEIRLLATRTADNRPLILSEAAIDPSRGNGRFGSLLRGNFTTEFSDWRVQVILFGVSSIVQEQTFPVVLDCTPPPPEPPAPPTEEPTEAPTEIPTEEPTETPTEEPTEVPTEIPTEEPTEEPTEAPTEEPTETPTEEPTEAPTEEPTEPPTEEPTEEPTEAPTETPTETPTEFPTEEPTEEPTEVPTEEPTESPIELPTEDPTETPTEDAPIELPTEEPIEEPVENAPIEEPIEDIPVEDDPAIEDPGAIQPVDDIDNPPATPVAAPIQRLADEVATLEPDDPVQVAALPVAGSGMAHGDHSTVLLAAIASSLVLGFISVTVRRGGMRRQ